MLCFICIGVRIASKVCSGFLLSFAGRAHWRAACSSVDCQGLNRTASEVRLRSEASKLGIKKTFKEFSSNKKFLLIFLFLRTVKALIILVIISLRECSI